MSRTLMARTMPVAALVLAAIPAAADVVVDWNRVMLATIAGDNPFGQGRVAAITQLAVFEAVNACTPTYDAYLGTLSAPPGASAEAAAVAAAHGVLKHYVPLAGASLDAARALSLAAIPDGQQKLDGIAVGESAASAMIGVRSGDGATPPRFFVPGVATPGVWQPTPPAFGPGLLLHWGNVKPFGVRSSDQFRADPPPLLTSEHYARDHGEVMRVGASASSDRPQDRTDVARFFAAVSAVHAWNLAVQQVNGAGAPSLVDTARAFALVNMAISDALVAAMETKYHYLLWRPVTAIRAGDLDGNPATDADPSWTSLVPAPSFPSYPSAHASASHAARRVAESLFGEDGHSFTLSHPAQPGITLTYTAFRELTEDIDDARVYGGIHFRFDQDAGGRQGRQIGRFIYEHYLRPSRGGQ